MQSGSITLSRDMADVSSTVLGASLEGAADGVFVIDGSGRILLYSPACERIFGYGAGEVVGQNIRILFPASTYDRLDRYIRRCLEADESGIGSFERGVQGRRKDDSVLPLNVSVAGVRGPQDRFVVGIVRDVSARELAEKELRQAHAFGAAVLDTVGALIMILDTDGRITHFNRACEQTTGFRSDEVVGQPVWDMLLPPGQIAGVEGVFAELARGTGVPNRFRNAWVTRDGERRIIEWSNTVLRDDTGAVINVIRTGIDVTDRLNQERQLNELQEQLFQVTRSSALGEMTLALAHEVNQPLSAAMSYVQAAKQIMHRELDSKRAFELLDKAVKEIGHAGEVIGKVQQFLRKGDIRRRQVDLSQIVDETLALTEMLQDQHVVRVATSIPSDLPSVHVDEVQIQQVLLNLVRNAIEAVSGQSRREVRIEAAQRTDDFVVVSVRDNGPGLAEDIRVRLFQPFVTNKPGGMGVGLSICRSIVRAHGGSIEAVADGDRGAIFRFTIPVAEQRDA